MDQISATACRKENQMNEMVQPLCVGIGSELKMLRLLSMMKRGG